VAAAVGSLYKLYADFLSMQARTAGYFLLTTVKLQFSQLNGRTAKFNLFLTMFSVHMVLSLAMGGNVT
jgi:hypothetical protein